MKKKGFGLAAVLVCVGLANACGGSVDLGTSAEAGPDPLDATVADTREPSETGPVDAARSDATPTPDASVDAGRDATVDASGDAGDASVDAADAGPGTGALTFRGCGALAACGGAVPGTWDFSGGCLENPLGAFTAQCPGLVERGLRGTLVGNMSFTGTNTAGAVTRTLQLSVVADVTFPSTCIAPASCALLPLVIGSQLPGATASCTGTSSCVCTLTYTRNENVSTTYVTAGNSMTFGNGEAHNYCVTGGQLRTKQTVAGPGQPAALTDGVFTLQKR